MRGFRYDSFAAILTAAVLAIFVTVAQAPAYAASPAEGFVAQNVQRGLAILNNRQLSKDQRRDQFQGFLLGLTDIHAIAEYTLGQYRRGAAPAELSAFDETFKNYALAVYQTYFDKFSGQTLQVMGSYALDPDETVVKTVMHDPAKPDDPNPLHVDFRVASEGGRLAVVDFSVGGVWLRETERSDFSSYLGQNGGNIGALINALKAKTEAERGRSR